MTWHESQHPITKKAPKHVECTLKNQYKDTQRIPFESEIEEGLLQFIIDYYNNEKPKRIIWKGKDFSEKTSKIEQKKLGNDWKIEPSPYEKDRFVVSREEPKLPLSDYIREYKKDLEIIYRQQLKRENQL